MTATIRIGESARQRREFERKAGPLRELWQVEEPELHKMPSWFRPTVNAAIKAGKLPKSQSGQDAWGLLYHAADECGGSRWLDHHGRLRLEDGSHTLISEPYGLSDDNRVHLEKFCSVLGLSYTVSDQSWWYPNRTIRITISKTVDV